MIEYIVYLVLAMGGDTTIAMDNEFATMEECMFQAGAYVGTVFRDPEAHGTGKEWHDSDNDGDYEVVILELIDGAGNKHTVICSEIAIPEKVI